MAHSFRGGVHPKYKKHTYASPIEVLEPSEIYIFPLLQHIGAVLEPVVNVGDKVLMGQKIADSSAPVSAPVHSSVSGIVTAIEPRYSANGSKVMSIIIKNDFLDIPCEKAVPVPDKPIEELTPEDIINIAREAGLVGMGGAAFPTHIKIKAAVDKKVDTLIINGAECEPYITADHRAMIEYPRPISGGIKLIMQALNLKHAFIGIEDNKEDAAATMKAVLKNSGVEIKELRTKYPQGGEKQLIKAIAGKEVPPGKLPMDIGCVVFNVDTCACLYRAVNNKAPLIKRVVTVSGTCISHPKNLLVRLGTPIADLINVCGGFVKDPKKVIMGGPMMGLAQHTLEVPIIKSSSAVLFFGPKDDKYERNPVCIRCGKCISVCPVNLMPIYINMFAEKGLYEECEKLNAADCIECGSCSYICPGRLYLVQTIRMSKDEINRKNKNKKEQKGADNNE